MAIPKIPVTITYRHPNARPPIFVAGGFSEPEWQPQEMEYTGENNGDHTFKVKVFAEAGSSFQYKFRLGTGDWWVLDEKAPTAADKAGNRNNVMHVPPVAEPSAPPAVAEKARRISVHEQPTAVENTAAATTDLKGPGAGDGVPRPFRNVAVEILNRSTPQSGASTPNFVRTAAEVADSAATLDKEESEPEISDREAGRAGVRRMSSTPIAEVSRTAAEVADSAKALDADCEEAIHGLELRPAEYDDLEPFGSGDPIPNESGTPLFAHECIGMYESDNDTGPQDSHGPGKHGRGDHIDADGTDLNDPTLERFPSNWEEIVDTVRKLEGGLNEDHATAGGIPLSPAISASRRFSCDPAGDLAVSPVAVSPVASRKSRHLGVPRSPPGSVGSDRSSALSLHSIPEVHEAGVAEGNDSSPLVFKQAAAKESRNEGVISPASDDSEGVVMKSPATKTSGRTDHEEPGSLNPGTVAPPVGPSSKTSTERTGETASAISQPSRALAATTESSALEIPKATTPESDIFRNPQREVNTIDTGKSTAVRANSSARRPKNRVTAPERVGTPTSINSVRLQADGDGNWFRIFFRMLFVDWIGGFISRIWNRARASIG